MSAPVDDVLRSQTYQRIQAAVLIAIAAIALAAAIHEVFIVQWEWWYELRYARETSRAEVQDALRSTNKVPQGPGLSATKDQKPSGESTKAEKSADAAMPVLPLRWSGALFLGVAALSIILPRIDKLSIGPGKLDVSIQQQADRERAITVKEQDPAPRAAAALLGAANANDPQKGMWGGQEVVLDANNNANSGFVKGKRVYATVLPSVTVPGFYLIKIVVCCTDPNDSLSGPVTFHLHPSFVPSDPQVVPQNGEATLELLAWGAFTVGAETTDGTQLELDLSTIPAPSADFRLR